MARCSLVPGEKNAKRKPLTELNVKGHFTEDRSEWQKVLQRHCEEVYTDMDETIAKQENRIEYFWKKEITNLQKTDAAQRSQWTSSCKPEPN